MAIRQVRRDSNDMLKALEKDKEITEDELHTGQDNVQKITDQYTAKVDEITAKKEKEILDFINEKARWIIEKVKEARRNKD